KPVRLSLLRLRERPLAAGARSGPRGRPRRGPRRRDPACVARRRRDRPRPVRQGAFAGRCGLVIEVGPNAYGKQAIRLVKVVRSEAPHRIYDLTIGIALEGDFASSYAEGDNSGVIATDTMKNTAYALAADRLEGSIEEFGIALARHFLGETQ